MAATMGEIIRAAREARGWTQRQLAEELGVSQSAVGSWETPTNPIRPDIARLTKIADVLDLDVRDLIGAAKGRLVPDAGP